MAVLGSPLDWGFVTEPEETLLNRTITYNRGRGLGGSSLISGLAYTRGSKSIYDLWQSLGNSGWSWDDVFPLFKKSTHFNPSKLNSSYMEFDPEAYGDGPLQVGYPGYVSPASVAFVESLSAINVTPVADLNSGDGVGTKQETLTLDDSYQRSSSYDSFYAQARGRPNLTVKKGALVTQILLEQGTAGLTATGVVFTDYLGGATVNATANKEVIMAAGTFQTPQLLMLSVRCATFVSTVSLDKLTSLN
jgi:choline dehydrogenase-like flavoprotein